VWSFRRKSEPERFRRTLGGLSEERVPFEVDPSAKAPCATRLGISAIITTPRGTIKAKTTSCCFLGRSQAEFPIEGRLAAGSDWADCSSIITERRHKVGPDPDPGILLGGISLYGLSGPEADHPGPLVVVACVRLPVWIVLGHNAVYITVTLVGLSFTDAGTMDEEWVARRDDRLYG